MSKREFDATKVPDLIELNKQLSEVNRQRHIFWAKLRDVKRQIAHYRALQLKDENEINDHIERLPENRREYLQNEWGIAKIISPNTLKQMMATTQLMGRTSLIEEEEHRKRKQPVFSFFIGRTCLNCELPITGKRKKYCSDACREKYRKRSHKQKKAAQAKLNTSEKIPPKTIKKKNPQPGNGSRNLDCLQYSDCLKIALNWKNFNCESCNLRKKT